MSQKITLFNFYESAIFSTYTKLHVCIQVKKHLDFSYYVVYTEF